MFKILVVLSCLALLAQCQAPPKPKPAPAKEAAGEKSEDILKTLREALKRMEAMDVETIMANDRVLTSHLKCMLNKGPCTQDGRNGKKLLTLLIETRCSECDAKQRKIIRKAMMVVKNKKPKEWSELVKLYDPKGTRLQELEKFLAGNRK